MLHTRLIPALIIHPFIGFSLDAGRTDDDIQYVAQVIESTPDTLKVHVLNGACNLTFGDDGAITDGPESPFLGKSAFLQWQGFETHQVRSEDFYADMLDHAQLGVRSGHTGPLHAAQLASSPRLAGLPIGEVAQRLDILGDGRLARFLASEYPQIRSQAK